MSSWLHQEGFRLGEISQGGVESWVEKGRTPAMRYTMSNGVVSCCVYIFVLYVVLF